MQKASQIKLFISFSSLAFYLHIRFFTYYLTAITFDPLSISILIGSITLTNILFGLMIGKFIDKYFFYLSAFLYFCSILFLLPFLHQSPQTIENSQ